MENQNILTIKFNDTEDLALKIAEWNGILNHQCCAIATMKSTLLNK